MTDHLGELDRAAAAFDWAGVHAVCVRFVTEVHAAGPAPSADLGAGMLRRLRAARRLDDLVLVADALTAAGAAQPLARRYLALSFADRGAPASARIMFRGLVAEAEDAQPYSETDLAEAEGGVARCEKDLFLLSGDLRQRAAHLNHAYRLYRFTYDRDPEHHYWQGINAVSLLARAAREGIRPVGVDDPAAEARTLAADVLRTTRTTSEEGPWPAATACEALVALGEHDEALREATRLLDLPVTPFQLNALIRQLTQLWELDELSAPGAGLIQLLRSQLLARDGSTITLEPSEIVGVTVEDRQEKVFGDDRFRTLAWYQRGLDCCRAVCRIETEFGDPIGTGFLIDRASLRLGTGPAVVTNAHVIPNTGSAREAFAVFEGLGPEDGGNRFPVSEILWISPPTQLDTTVALLDGGPSGTGTIEPAGRLPDLAARTPARAYVIGHPQGMKLQFSLHDNQILDSDGVRLHYRSPTDHGSSGSPVFDNDWKLIGLHHEGSDRTPRLNGRAGTYQANEAIVFSAIRAAIG